MTTQTARSLLALAQGAFTLDPTRCRSAYDSYGEAQKAVDHSPTMVSGRTSSSSAPISNRSSGSLGGFDPQAGWRWAGLSRCRLGMFVVGPISMFEDGSTFLRIATLVLFGACSGSCGRSSATPSPRVSVISPPCLGRRHATRSRPSTSSSSRHANSLTRMDPDEGCPRRRSPRPRRAYAEAQAAQQAPGSPTSPPPRRLEPSRSGSVSRKSPPETCGIRPSSPIVWG